MLSRNDTLSSWVCDNPKAKRFLINISISVVRTTEKFNLLLINNT